MSAKTSGTPAPEAGPQDDEKPQDGSYYDDAPPPDGDRTPATGATYRVPQSLNPRTLREEEPIVVTSLEVACQYDARLWRRGPMPW
jgi:hypothetical protein